MLVLSLLHYYIHSVTGIEDGGAVNLPVDPARRLTVHERASSSAGCNCAPRTDCYVGLGRGCEGLHVVRRKPHTQARTFSFDNLLIEFGHAKCFALLYEDDDGTARHTRVNWINDLIHHKNCCGKYLLADWAKHAVDQFHVHIFELCNCPYLGEIIPTAP